MAKKIEIEVNGRTVRVMEHMLSDLEKFGASRVKRVIKEMPRELMIIPARVLPEMKTTEPISPIRVEQELPKIRKKPVRSKSK